MALGDARTRLDPEGEPNDRALLDLLGREPDPELMPTAAAALVSLGGEGAAEPLLDLWRRADEDARHGIVDALAVAEPDREDAAAALLERLDASGLPLDPGLRARADEARDR
jgi:hypothetical protein